MTSFPVKMEQTNSETCFDDKKKRIRSPNFSPSEVEVLVSQYRQYKVELDNPRVSQVAKANIWSCIASVISQIGVASRTSKEVKNKWFNLSRESKQVHANAKRHAKQTGGGPGLESPGPVTSMIIDVMQDDVGFVGISGGLESDCFTAASTSTSSSCTQIGKLDLLQYVTTKDAECSSDRLETCGGEVETPKVAKQDKKTVCNDNIARKRVNKTASKASSAYSSVTVNRAVQRYYTAATVNLRLERDLIRERTRFFREVNRRMEEYGNNDELSKLLFSTLEQ